MSTAAAEVRAGVSAASLGADSTLAAPTNAASASAATPSSGSAATPDSAAECGSIHLTVTPNNPKNGWFHEQETWSGADVFLAGGDFTAVWDNLTTGGGNSYSWQPAGQIDYWSGTHNVYSKAGKVRAYTYGNGVTETDQVWSCTYNTTNTVTIYVS